MEANSPLLNEYMNAKRQSYSPGTINVDEILRNRSH